MTFNYSFFLGCLFFANLSLSQTPVKLSNDQFQFTEGPVWDGIGSIYFTDNQAQIVYKYSLSMNSFSEVVTNTNGGNGMMFNENEDLIICEGNANRVQRRSVTGNELETLASTYNNIEFNEPNDLCIDKRGGIYFTDPTWTEQPQGNNRLYYREPNGEINALLDYGNNKPNGVIISADGTQLYINDSWSIIVKRYDINADGSITNEVDFAILNNPSGNNISGADGMAIDTNGNLYVTAKKTVQVFNSSGILINTINFPENAANCTFGSSNKDVLFVTASKNLYKVELPGVTGVRHPFDLPGNPLSTDAFTLGTRLIKLYPNPVNSNSFSLELAKKYIIKSVIIFDSLGKQIETPLFLVNGKKTEVVLSSSLQSGIYLVTINTSKGDLKTKLVIE